MSIGSISDVLTRISGIEQQLQSLQSGTLLDSALGVSGDSSASSSATTSSSDSSSSTDFADELAAAEQGDSSDATDNATSDATDAATSDGTDDLASTLGDTASASGTTFGSLADSALGTGSLLGSSSSSGVALSSSASSQLTSGQQQFASTLSADTGLNPNVVGAWLLAEESGGAAQSRQSANNNDWLNIGYTDSATYGASDSVWSDPTAAANATAAWLKGGDSIPGYGTASSGIQSILSSVGQTPAAQIQAIQQSGWSSGGYPSLGSLYTQVAGY